MERIEEVLTGCIAEIRAGRSTVDECLDRHPSRRNELEPLLRLAVSIRGLPAVSLDADYKQSARASLMRQIAATGHKKRSRSLVTSFNSWLPSFAWARVAAAVLGGIVVLSMLTGGTALAARSSLPGEVLYPVKMATENARLLLAGDTSSRVKLYLQFARNRLEEMKTVSGSNEQKTELALNGYRRDLASALEGLQRVPDLSVASDLPGLVLRRLQDQVSLSDEILDSNPPYTEVVREAGALSVGGQLQALEMLYRYDMLEAAGISTQEMQTRLQRALAKADKRDYQTMAQLLLQYQQFGRLNELILGKAQSQNDHSGEIEGLILQALSSGPGTLDQLAQEVPPEYQDSIESVRQTMTQLQMQARQGEQGAGGQGQDGGGPPVENNGGPTYGPDGQPGSQTQEGSGGPDGAAPGTGTASPTISSPGGGGSGGSDNATQNGAGPGGGDGGGGQTSGGGTPNTPGRP